MVVAVWAVGLACRALYAKGGSNNSGIGICALSEVPPASPH